MAPRPSTDIPAGPPLGPGWQQAGIMTESVDKCEHMHLGTVCPYIPRSLFGVCDYICGLDWIKLSRSVLISFINLIVYDQLR